MLNNEIGNLLFLIQFTLYRKKSNNGLFKHFQSKHHLIIYSSYYQSYLTSQYTEYGANRIEPQFPTSCQPIDVIFH